MGTVSVRAWSRGVWDLAHRQHGVVTHAQLRELGMGGGAVRHRIASGRLHRLTRGVYAVGRPGLTDRGRWMAAVLACGPQALLSHRSAATLHGVRRRWGGPVEVVIPAHLARRRPGVRVYRRGGLWPEDLGALGRGDATARGSRRAGDPAELLRPQIVDEIPVTSPVVTLVDLATCLPTGQLEAAINEADHLGLVDPETLRSAIDGLPGRPGVRPLRTILDTASHALTTTALEGHFLPLALSAGLPVPQTQVQLGRHRVDFYWADLGLIVETDSLRYHRTPFKQAADKRRDNEHAGSGLTTLRFTHGQVLFEPGYVRTQLRTVARRLRPGRRDRESANG
jgi:very-short-patch-repair endonuclease